MTRADGAVARGRVARLPGSDSEPVPFLASLLSSLSKLLDDRDVALLAADADGAPGVAAASTDTAGALERAAFRFGAGPGLAALRGEPVGELDLCHPPACWAGYASAARSLGYASVGTHALSGREPVGALVVLGRERRSLPPSVERAMPHLIDIARDALRAEHRLQTSIALAAQLQVSLDDRLPIEQAKGALAASFRISPEEAFERLRRHARRNSVRVRDVAGAVASGQMPPAQFSEPEPVVTPRERYRAPGASTAARTTGRS